MIALNNQCNLTSVLVAFMLLASELARSQDAFFDYDVDGNLVSNSVVNRLMPVLSNEPRSALVGFSGTASLSVVASGYGLSYQWLSNGVAISGATNDSLSQVGLRLEFGFSIRVQS